MSERLDFAIRQMTEDDLSAVAEIEAGVFTDWYRIHRRQPEPLAERKVAALRYAVSFDPDANHVALATDGAMVGFILARTWGRVGWFGTFAVPTQFQGLGVGRALVDRTVASLEGKVDVIGLETMPDSGANLGLYAKAGFVVLYPTILLELSLIQEADRLKGLAPDEVDAWDGTDARVLREIRNVSDRLIGGLDYSREVRAIAAHDFGTTLLSRGQGGTLDGFAILRTFPFRNEDASGRAYVHALAIRPGAPDERVLTDLLRQIWTAATTVGFSRLAVGVNARHQRALSLLLEGNFLITGSTARMVRTPVASELLAPTDTIDLSRWAG